MSIIVDWVREFLGSLTPMLLVAICVISAVASVLYSCFRSLWLPSSEAVARWFTVSLFEVILCVIGAIVAIMVWVQVGPDIIIGELTGEVAFSDVGENLVLVLLCGCLLLPLLTDFGFMEFIGTLVQPVFIRLFGLPGRAALDATASFVAASNVGLLITIDQYKQGYYSERDAAVVATNFTVISLPFIVFISSVAGIERLLFPWMLTIIVACFIAALITPRLPPLSRKPRTFFENQAARIDPAQTAGKTLLNLAFESALRRAQSAPNVKSYFMKAGTTYLELMFSIAAISIAIVALSTIVINFTTLFQWLSAPLVPVMELLNLVPAEQVAPGFLVGFLELFLPSLIAQGLDVEYTRFVLAGVSVCQLIYMSEVGVLILRSVLPVRLGEMMLIFLLRTVICTPIFIVSGWFFIG